MSETGSPTERTGPDRVGEVCQLVWMDVALQPLNPVERALRRARIRLRGFLRRVGVFEYSPLDAHRAPPWRRPPALASVGARKTRGSGAVPDVPPPPPRRALESGKGLKAGDLVRVRPLDEIGPLLDRHHRYDGLSFMRPMTEHCGKTYRVLKRVKRLVNDSDHTVRKSRGVVILDGVFCHGRGVYGREDCDRTCFYFWKEAWLEKVDE